MTILVGEIKYKFKPVVIESTINKQTDLITHLIG